MNATAEWIDERLPIYAETQKKYGYGSITLLRKGEYACVEIEYQGKTIEVLRAFFDDNFCDCITELGIAEKIEREGKAVKDSRRGGNPGRERRRRPLIGYPSQSNETRKPA